MWLLIILRFFFFYAEKYSCSHRPCRCKQTRKAAEYAGAAFTFPFFLLRIYNKNNYEV